MRHFSGRGTITSALLVTLFLLHHSPDGQAQSDSQPVAPHIDASALETNYVFLKWVHAEGVTGYRIERKFGGDNWIEIAQTGEANSFIDRDVVGGVTYTYRIRASNSAGFSSYSNEASTT